MAWSYHLFPVSCLTDFNFAIEVGEKAKRFPAESSSTWEILFFCLTNPCLIIFTLHTVYLWGSWDMGEDSFSCRVMMRPYKWSGCQLDLVRTNTDVFTPCSLNPCPSLTFLPPAWPTPIPHMLSSAWDSSDFMRSRITFSVNEIKIQTMHSASGWVNMAHRSDWWIVFIHEQFLQNFLLTPNHYQMWVAGGCWNSNTCCITLNGIHFGKHRKFHFSK